MAITFRDYAIMWSDTFRKDYLPGIADIIPRHGKTTRLMDQNKHTLDGLDLEIEVKAYNQHGTRASMYGMDPMPEPGLAAYTRFTPRFNYKTEAENDFVFLEHTWRTAWFERQKRGDSTWKGDTDPITTDIEDGLASLKSMHARYVHLPVDGKLADLVAAGDFIRDDDSDVWASCTTPYTAGESGAVFKLATNSIARIGIGEMIEFRTAAGDLIVNNVRVTDVHPFEQTIFASVTADSVDDAGAEVTNFDDVSQTDNIYKSGCYNVAPIGSIAHFFDITQTYYQRDRTDPTYHALRPIRHVLSGTPSLTADHLRKVAISAAWGMGSSDSKPTRAIVMAQDQYNAIAKFAKDAGMTVVPGNQKDVGSTLKYVVGEDGYVLYDPNLGHVALGVDDFAEYGQIAFLDMSTWHFIMPWGGSDTFAFIDGDIGYWTRNSEDDGSGRPSKIYSANGIMSYCRFCNGAKRNILLSGLDTSA